MIFHFSGINIRSTLLSHMGCCMFRDLRNCKTFPEQPSQAAVPPAVDVIHSLCPCVPVSQPAFGSAVLPAILTGVWWYLVVVVCIPLVANSVEWLFICLFVIYKSSVVKCSCWMSFWCLFIPFAYFVLGSYVIGVIDCWVLGVLLSVQRLVLCQTCGLQIFSVFFSS